ncbi:MAG: hypothetical protein AAGD43_32275 [Pseudomonadota bacterium]
MSGRLFVHIGPPKTGSTALQMALQNIDKDDFGYLGVRQPRSANDRTLSALLDDYCSGREPVLGSDLKTELTTVRDRVANGETLVLSEELFLVWEPEADIWAKLDRLDQMLSDIERTYVATLRDPIQALPSYFQELYAHLSMRERGRPAEFFEHPRCDCYDYEKLTAWFEDRDLELRYIGIEHLARGTAHLRQLLGASCKIDAELTIPSVNSGTKSSSGEMRVLQPTRLTDLTKTGLQRRLVDKLKTTSPRLHSAIRQWARSVVLKPESSQTLEVPAARAEQLQCAYRRVRERAMVLSAPSP